ncbi:MAG: WD40 repeat domain-containing protein [Planctomycetota bacterium]|jgi:WD40 repeat protein
MSIGIECGDPGIPRWIVTAVLLLCGIGSGLVPVIPDARGAESSDPVTTIPLETGVRLRLVKRLQEGDGEGKITALAESFDGKFLAWGDDRGTVRLYSFDEKKRRTILDLSHLERSCDRVVRDLAFDNGGRLWWLDASENVYCAVLAAGKDPEIKKVIARRLGHCFMSPNLLPWGVVSEAMTLSLPPKTYLSLLEVGTGAIYESDVLFPDNWRKAKQVFMSVVRSPDGELLMAVGDLRAALLSLPDMNVLHRFDPPYPAAAAFSPGSKLVALATRRGDFFVWETETGKLVKSFPPPGYAVRARSLVFVGEDILYAADLPMYRFDLKTGSVNAVAGINAMVLLLSRSGDRLFVGTCGGGVEVFEVPPADRPRKPPETTPASLPDVNAAESSDTVATRPSQPTVRLRPVQRLQAGNRGDEEGDITALAESADGKFLAWGNVRGDIRLHSFDDKKSRTIWDVEEFRRQIRTVAGLSKDPQLAKLAVSLQDLDVELGRVEDLAFDDKGRLCWADDTGTHYCDVSCAELAAGKEVWRMKDGVGTGNPVVPANLLPWGVLSTVRKPRWSRVERLKIFEVGTGAVHESNALFPVQGVVNTLFQRAARSPDGNLLMAVAYGDSVLLSLPDMKVLRRFGQYAGKSAAFSPSSRLVALGTIARGVLVWETGTGKLVKAFDNSSPAKTVPSPTWVSIDSLVFAGEDTLYAADYRLYRIDLKTGSIDAVADVNATVLRLSRSGDRLFVGTYGGGVEVFEIPLADRPQAQR